ncbi:SDR family NAD(P)-dependent oxidoreductase [Pendulispora rubella]|uniref:SDR family NAD(P)-dependent oxidoreductase n=1 Tax=Pendulispora rubella TaxID=2741070 RepID=A0ABZ2KU68_9BACT
MPSSNTEATSLEGLHILVTGSTDGIGAVTAEELGRAGAIVYVHGRNADKIERTLASLRERGVNAPRGFRADLASLADTAKLAKQIVAQVPQLDVLINNAGIGTGGSRSQREISQDGFELRFAVNYLATFVLTRNLIAAGRIPRAVIHVSSIGQEDLDFDDLMLERHYSGVSAYCRSKLAQILFAFDLAESHPRIKTHALHPGTYLDTNMVRQAGVRPLGSAGEGADAILFVTRHALSDSPNGLYFDQQRTARPLPQAYDRTARARLRKASEELAAPFLS